MLPTRPSLTLFAHIVTLPEDELELAQAALLFAESEHKRLDFPYYIAVLDDLGAAARREIDARADATLEMRVRMLLDWLYRVQGFRGNASAYYDPRNSYLDDVLERRTGIPITLGIVLLEVAARAGIEAHGVSFPGHFLVRMGETIVVDPFHGRVLGKPELAALYARVGGSGEPDSRLLEPCDKRQILTRMLLNLHNIHAAQGDDERLRNVLEHLVTLTPSPELQHELALLGGSRALLGRSAMSRSLN